VNIGIDVLRRQRGIHEHRAVRKAVGDADEVEPRRRHRVGARLELLRADRPGTGQENNAHMGNQRQ
jgi:hypothetical protein